MYTCKRKLLTRAWAQGRGPWGGCRAGPGPPGPGTLGPALAATHGLWPWAQAHVRSLSLHVYMFRYTYMYIVTIYV